MSAPEKTESAPLAPSIANVETIAVTELISRTRALFKQGARFVTATCPDAGEQFEIYYHFDREMALSNLRVLSPKGEKVPSLTQVYYCAFAAENEMSDMFGVEFSDLALDYDGKLLIPSLEGAPPLVKTPAGTET